MASRFRSPAEQEVQDYLAKVAAGQAGQDPAAQTAARSDNPVVARQGMRDMAIRGQDNLANQEAAIREQERAAKAAAAEQERAARQAARDAEKAARAEEAQRVRAGAALGQKTVTDIGTGRRTIATHEDGSPVYKTGPVGAPQPLVAPTNNPLEPAPVVGFQQEYRNDRGQTKTVPLETKTDPKTGEISYTGKDEFGAPAKQALGVDPVIQQRQQRLGQLETEKANADLRRLQLQQARAMFEPKWQPAKAEFLAAKSKLESLGGKYIREPNPKHGQPARWGEYNSTGQWRPLLDPAKDDRFMAWQKDMADAGQRAANARKAYEPLRAHNEKLTLAEREARLSWLNNRAEKIRIEQGLPDDDGGLSMRLAQAEDPAAGDIHDDAVAEIGEATQTITPTTETVTNEPSAAETITPTGQGAPAPATPAVADAFKSLQGLQGVTLEPFRSFTALNRGGKWIGSLQKNEAGENIVTLRDDARGQEDITRIVRDTDRGVPVYLRDNGNRPKAMEEAARVAGAFRLIHDPETDPETAAKTLRSQGLDPMGIRRAVDAGEMSVQNGKVLLREIWGDTLDAERFDDPEAFRRFLAEDQKRADARLRDTYGNPALSDDQGAAKRWQRATSKDGVAGLTSDYSRGEQEQVRMDFARHLALKDAMKPGVTRGEIIANYARAAAVGGDKRLSAANKLRDLVVNDVLGSMTGLLAGGVANASQAEMAILGVDGAKKALDESMRLRGRDWQNWKNAAGRNLKAWGTAGGRSAARNLDAALANLRSAIDEEADKLEPDKARVAAAEMNVRARALALHSLSPDPSWPVTIDSFDPDRDAALGNALADYQATADPRSFALYKERLLMDNGRRQLSAELMERNRGTGGFLGSVKGAMNAGWQELGAELLADAAVLVSAGGSKVLQGALRGAGAAGRAARVENAANRISRGLEGLWNAGIKRGTLQKPLGALDKTRNLAVRGAQGAVGEGMEEVLVSPGEDQPDPLGSFAVGMLGGITLAPAAVIASGIRSLAPEQQAPAIRRSDEKFAARYNAENASTAGFEPITPEIASSARSLINPERDQQARGEIGRLVTEYARTGGDPQIRQQAARRVAEMVSAQDDAVQAARSIAAIQDPARRTYAAGMAKIASGNEALLTANERRAVQGARTQAGADFFESVPQPDGTFRETLTQEGLDELQATLPAVARLAGTQPATPQANVPQPETQAPPAQTQAPAPAPLPQEPGATGMGGQGEAGGGAPAPRRGVSITPDGETPADSLPDGQPAPTPGGGGQAADETADPFEGTDEDADALEAELEAELQAELEAQARPEGVDVNETPESATQAGLPITGETQGTAPEESTGPDTGAQTTEADQAGAEESGPVPTPKSETQARGVAREVMARITRKLPGMKGRIRVSETRMRDAGGGEFVSGGLYAQGGEVVIVLPDIAREIESAGGDARAVADTLERTARTHEIVHIVQFYAVREAWEKSDKALSWGEFFNQTYGRMAGELGPRVMEEAARIYGETAWSRLSPAQQAAEVVRMLVESRLNPDAPDTSELFRAVRAAQSPTFIDMLKRAIEHLAAMLRNGELPKDVAEEVDKIEALYRELAGESPKTQTNEKRQPQPQAKPPQPSQQARDTGTDPGAERGNGGVQPTAGKKRKSKKTGETGTPLTDGDRKMLAALDGLFASPTQAQPFYSQLARTLEAKMPKNATPAQVVQIAASGAKAEEVKWSGLIPWLQGREKVSKDEVLAWLANEGAVRFEEVTLGNAELPEGTKITELRPGLWEATDKDGFVLARGDSYQEVVGVLFEYPSINQTKFSQYALPGGENYREVVLAMPVKADPADVSQWTATRNTGRRLPWAGAPDPIEVWEIRDADGGYIRNLPVSQFPTAESALTRSAEMYDSRDEQGRRSTAYTSSHFPDVPNYVAHMRLNERTDADGAPGLFVEEFQSDRHQAGRKSGYASPRWTPEEEARARELEAPRPYPGLTETEREEYRALLAKEAKSGIAPAPYQTTWPLALFKRALRDAVAGGKTWIGWTPGQVHTDRWGTERIRWEKQPDGTFLVDAKQQVGGVAGDIDLEREADTRGMNAQNSRKVGTLNEFIDTITPALTEGQDPQKLGEKLWAKMQSEPSGVSHPRKEGFEVFYDNMLPKEIGKYVKQWGAKVEKGIINKAPSDPYAQVPFGQTEEGNAIWRINITDAMRKGVEAGQPLFSSPAPQSYDATIPADRMGALMDAAGSWLAEGIRTPEALAAKLDGLAGGALKPFTQSIWFAMKAVGAKGAAEPDWAKLYGADQQPFSPEAESERPAKPKPAKQPRRIDSPARRAAFAAVNSGEHKTITRLIGEVGRITPPPPQIPLLKAKKKAGKKLSEAELKTLRDHQDYDGWLAKNQLPDTADGRVAREVLGLIMAPRGEGLTPSVAAQGVNPAWTPDQLWMSIRSELGRIAKGRKESADDPNRQSDPDAAEIARAESAADAARDQSERFDAANTAENGRPLEVSAFTPDMVGQYVTVDGERMKVASVDWNSFLEQAESVTLEDGTRFGRQILEDGEVVYVEVEAPKKSTPASAMDRKNADSKELFADDGGFQLAQQTTQDGDKIAAERKAKEDAQAESDKAQTTMFGDEPKPQGKIEDFGEKIGGARKDLWGKFRDSLDNELPEDGADITLSKHLPEPDYEAAVAAGVPVDNLATYKALRDMIPAKPRRPYKLRQWIETVRGIRPVMRKLMGGVEEGLSQAESEILARHLRDSGMGDRVNFYKDLGYPAFTQAGDWKILNGVTKFRNGVAEKRRVTAALFKGRFVDGMESAEEGRKGHIEVLNKIRDTIAAKLQSAPDDKRRKAIEFNILKDRLTGDIFIGKKAVNGWVRLKTGFKEVKEARQYLADNRQALEDQWNGLKKPVDYRRQVNEPRQGPERRPGDVTPEMFQDAFGFRGVQFGNWVEGDRRQVDLNEAFDAFMDLAEALGIPPKAVSLDGSLGLAFGARGIPNAKAHYEPDQVVINLTKKSGPGSLAHEWFHAFDNYFARLDRTGETAVRAMDKYGTQFSGAPKNMRPEVWEAFKRIRLALDSGTFAERSKELDQTKSKPYYSTIIEKAARAFERYTVDRLEGMEISNDFLVNITKDNSPALPNQKEMNEGIREAYDHLFNTLDTRETDKGVMLFSSPTRRDTGTPDLFAAASAPDAKEKLGEVKVGRIHALNAYRALSAKKAKVGLSAAEEQQLLDVEQALGQKLAFDMDQVRGEAPAVVKESSTTPPPLQIKPLEGITKEKIQSELKAGERTGNFALVTDAKVRLAILTGDPEIIHKAILEEMGIRAPIRRDGNDLMMEVTTNQSMAALMRSLRGSFPVLAAMTPDGRQAIKIIGVPQQSAVASPPKTMAKLQGGQSELMMGGETLKGGQMTLFSSPTPNPDFVRVRKALAEILTKTPESHSYEPTTETRSEVVRFLKAYGLEAVAPTDLEFDTSDIERVSGAQIVFFTQRGTRDFESANSLESPRLIAINAESGAASIGYLIAHEMVHVAQKASNAPTGPVLSRLQELISQDELKALRKFLVAKGYDSTPQLITAEIHAHLTADAVTDSNTLALPMLVRSGEVKSALIEYFQSLPYLEPDAQPGQYFSEPGMLFSSPTPEQDAEYLAAVARGDMETAQRMVDDAAKAAGYEAETYVHETTSKEKFTEFKVGGPNIRPGQELTMGDVWGDKKLSGHAIWFRPKNGRGLAAHRKGEKRQVAAKLRLRFPLMDDRAGIEAYGGFSKDFPQVVQPSDSARLKELGRDSVVYLDGKGEIAEVLVFDPSQIKSADPVTYDQSGDVIPLSKRFDQSSDSILFSSPAKRSDPLLDAIKKLITAPEKKAETYARMNNLVNGVRKRFDTNRLKAEFSKQGVNKQRYTQIRDVAILEAVAKSLPPEIRGKLIGSFRRLDELKTERGREQYLLKMLPKIEAALEKHLQKLYRQDIRKVIDKSRPRPNDSRNLRGRIGAVGHAIAKQAVDAMTMDTREALAAAAALRDRIEQSDELDLDTFEELEGRAMALELFADYETADSARLEKALEFLKDVYGESRSQWLEVLGQRKQQREADIEALRAALKAPEFITNGMLAEAKAKSEKITRKFADSMLEWISSYEQILNRLKENTDDPRAVAWVDGQIAKLRDARGAYDDRLEAERVALEEAMEEIFGTRKGWVGKFDLDPILHEMSQRRDDHGVTVLEGVKEETIIVPKHLAESLVRREVSGYDYNGKRYEITAQDMPALTEAWERFEELPEEAQAKKRVLSFTRRISAGKRNKLGPYSQLELLKEWLAMRQTDVAAKYKSRGWDATTMEEMERALKPEVKRLGLWMVDHLEKQSRELDAKHREEYGIGLDLVDHYFPTLFEAAQNQDSTLSMDGVDVNVAAKTASGLKSRVAHNARPKQMNAISVFLANRAQIHYFMTHATPLREMLGVFRSIPANQALRVTLGDNYTRNLGRELKLIETNGMLNADGVLEAEKFIRKVQSGYALGILGLKLSTLAINTTAVLNTLLGVPAAKLVKGFTPEYVGDLRRFFDTPAVQRRLKHGSSHEVRLASQGGIGSRPLAARGRRLAQASMQAINWWDTFSNGILGAAAYRAALEEARKAGLPEAEAVKRAEAEIDRLSSTVMQPNNMLSRSVGEVKLSQNPMAGLMFLFATEPRKNMAIGLYALRKLLTGKGHQSAGMAAQQIITLGLFYSALGYLIRSAYQAAFKGEDDEPEELAKRLHERLTDSKGWTNALLTEHLKGFPMIGEAMARFVTGLVNDTEFIKGERIKQFDASPNPLNRATKAAFDAAAVADDKLTPEQKADQIIRSVQGTLGMFPETAVLAQAGNVARDALGLLTGNGMELSSAEKIRRMKRRFGKFQSGLPRAATEDGRTDPEAKARRDQRVVEYLRGVSASLAPDDRRAFLEAIDKQINEDVRAWLNP